MRRSGFTLLEALLATALVTILMSVMATVWQNAFRMAERTRALLQAHQRARTTMELAETTLLERSGTMPLIAQDSAQNRRYPFKLGAWASRVHIDGTEMSVTDQSQNESGGDLNGDGDTNDSFPRHWADDIPATTPKDAFAPGRGLRNAVIGNWGWSWGMDRRLIWHSDILRFDTSRCAIDPSKTAPTWQYGQVEYQRELPYVNDVTDALTNGWYLSMLHRRYQPNAPTSFNANGEETGPYRGVAIIPWVHRDASGTQRPTPWLGMSHIWRIVSGPTSFMQPDSRGQPMRQTTGDHGQTNAVPILPNGQTTASNRPLEPDWGFVTPGSWNPDATDPAIGTPRPAYGTVVTDNGGVQWRCEAPPLLMWSAVQSRSGNNAKGMVVQANMSDNAGTWKSNNHWRAAQLRNVLAISNGSPDVSGVVDWAFKSSYDELVARVASGNVSRFVVRTARMPTAWSDATLPNAAPRLAARGRWGPLTLPGWWDGSTSGPNNSDNANPNRTGTWTGLTVGFPGAAPSSAEAPSHPWWTSVEVGVAGGFVRGTGFELRFTTALVLR